MTSTYFAPARRILIGALLTSVVSTAAYATDGYFQYGYGARQKALGGAGVADSRDATAAALNPAGLVNVPDQVDFSATLFSPWRTETSNGVTVDSDRNYFGVPNLAWSKQVHNPFFDAVALAMYGNGGMNTDYKFGVFGAGKTGVDLQQAFLSAAFAKRLAPNVSVGVAPVIAHQQFKAFGLGMFRDMSSDPADVTNNGFDHSWGGGVRAGLEWAITPSVRLGVAGNSRVYMQDFDKYRGLFAERGSLDIPASVQAGIAIDIRPDLTFMADYKFINYSDIKSINNPSSNIFVAQLGADNGPGFGWHDINILKLGLEWRATPESTYRVGYSHNDNPIKSPDAMFNILAPGVVQDHFTAGAEFKLSERTSLELAGAYVPEASVTGSSLMDGSPVEIKMHQYEVTAGIKYRLDTEPEPLK